MERYPPQLVLAVFSLASGFVSIGVISTIAVVLQAPFVFPSAGATAFLLFFSPLTAAASPRNTMIGHAIGALAGWFSLAAFGLLDADPALPADVSWMRVLAASSSLGLTGAFMVLLRAPHPPAGATALIVSLGLMPGLDDVAILLAAIGLLVVQAIAINRLAGFPYPLWRLREQAIVHGPDPPRA